MKNLVLLKNPLSHELSNDIKQELGLTDNSIARMYNDYQESNSLFESHFVIEEPFEKVLMLKVAREFFNYNQAKGD